MRPPEPDADLVLPMPIGMLIYCLDCIGWTNGEVARRARMDDVSVGQMISGKRQVPEEMARWLWSLAKIHRALWEPENWQPKGKAAAKPLDLPMYEPIEDDTAPLAVGQVEQGARAD